MVTKQIILGCKQKKRVAYKQCYEACAPYVYAIVKNYIHEQNDRKDAMQDVFAHVFHSIDKYDEEKGSFKSWLGRVTVNQTINFLKRNNKLSYLVPLTEQHDFAEEQEEKVDIAKMNMPLLRKMIENMPTGYKAVFLLSFMEGYTHQEIAQILDISSQTSRSQLSRAIKWVRTQYKKQKKSISYG